MLNILHCHMLFQILFLVSSISAISLPLIQSLNNQLLLPLNESTTLLNSSTLNTPNTLCDDFSFRSSLGPQSCRQVIPSIPLDDVQKTWTHRVPYKNYGLPVRILSCEYLQVLDGNFVHPRGHAYLGIIAADGKCSVQVYLLKPYLPAHASFTEIRQGAQAVYDSCAKSESSYGGIAYNIGEYRYER